MDLIEAHAETLIVATHDLTILSRFETIIVMINGKIVERETINNYSLIKVLYGI